MRLGEFHISTNFLGVIGSHMNENGLTEAWTESKMLGRKGISYDGKEYNKAIRAHKLTCQALWQLLYPPFLESHNPTLRENLYSV